MPRQVNDRPGRARLQLRHADGRPNPREPALVDPPSCQHHTSYHEPNNMLCGNGPTPADGIPCTAHTGRAQPHQRQAEPSQYMPRRADGRPDPAPPLLSSGCPRCSSHAQPSPPATQHKPRSALPAATPTLPVLDWPRSRRARLLLAGPHHARSGLRCTSPGSTTTSQERMWRRGDHRHTQHVRITRCSQRAAMNRATPPRALPAAGCAYTRRALSCPVVPPPSASLALSSHAAPTARHVCSFRNAPTAGLASTRYADPVRNKPRNVWRGGEEHVLA